MFYSLIDDVTLPPPPPEENQNLGDYGSAVIGPAAAPQVEDSGVLKLKDDPRFAKYFMMKRMNMPDGAIMHKMQMDGIDPNFWRYVLLKTINFYREM